MSMFPIATYTLPSPGPITFQNIPDTFTHLQLRVFGRTTASQVPDQVFIRLNNDTTAGNHNWHYLQGDGATASSGAGISNETGIRCQAIVGANASANVFGAVIIDILDYTNTNKFKTVKSIGGGDNNGSGQMGLSSGLYRSTNVINRIDIYGLFLQFASGTRADLYGLTTSTVTGA